MCVLLITRLLRGVGRWARKPVNHTSWVAVVTSTDRPKSVSNRCLIELFCGVVCVVALPFRYFCWCRGFCHRTGSDLLLFVLTGSKIPTSLTKIVFFGPMRKRWLSWSLIGWDIFDFCSEIDEVFLPVSPVGTLGFKTRIDPPYPHARR